MSRSQGFSEKFLSRDSDLGRAGDEWVKAGRSQKLIRWLSRALNDPERLPRFGAPSDWWEILDALLTWREARPEGWPESVDDLAVSLIKNTLRFSRTDGSAVFEAEGGPPGRSDRVHRWVDRLDDPAIRTVAQWWFPMKTKVRTSPSAPIASPPLPAVAAERRVLAMLRPDWLARGDFLAVDQPSEASGSRIELRGAGRWLLGPDWSFADREGASTSPRRDFWSTLSRADVLEWSVRCGSSPTMRTAVLLRGAQMALLAEQFTPIGAQSTVSLPVAPGVSASLEADRSFGLLRVPGLKAQVLPMAWDSGGSDLPTRVLALNSSGLTLELPSPGRRIWVAWLVVWDSARTRRSPVVRPLTVTTRTVRCRPDEAQAYRVGWGTGLDSLVVYRSLSRPDLRTFLGHQTSDRFLVGWFHASGNLTPLVSITA